MTTHRKSNEESRKCAARSKYKDELQRDGICSPRMVPDLWLQRFDNLGRMPDFLDELETSSQAMPRENNQIKTYIWIRQSKLQLAIQDRLEHR